MAKCQKCGCGLDSSYTRDDRTGKLFCSRACMEAFRVKLRRLRFARYSIVQAGEGAPTAQAPVAPAAPAKPETQVDRWARGLTKMEVSRQELMREDAARSAAEQAEIEANVAERAELTKLERRYVSGRYLNKDLARLAELRAKHLR